MRSRVRLPAIISNEVRNDGGTPATRSILRPPKADYRWPSASRIFAEGKKKDSRPKLE